MDKGQLQKNFDCALDVDENDKPLHDVVILGSPVETDAVVAQHLAENAEKVDVVLELYHPLTTRS